MDKLVNAACQAEYQPVRPRNNTPYIGYEDRSSCPTEIVSDIAANTTQSLPETTNFSRIDGHTFQGLVLSTGSTRLRGEADMPQENPRHRNFKAKVCGLQTPSVRDRLYTFLLSSSLM